MPSFRCALDIARAIREKKVSPVEVLREYLKVCDQKNAALNAFVWRRDEAALADAGEDVLAELWTEACGAWVPVAVAPVRWVPPTR